MRKLFLITTAIIGTLTASPVEAAPVATVVALMSGGASFGAAMTAVFGTFGVAAMQLGLSILLSMAVAPGKPKQDKQRAELTRPGALPAYRYIYGKGWAPGTPVAWTVLGDVLYIGWLVNSRPSALSTHTILFDKRGVTPEGDPFDFAGPGATGVNSVFGNGHVRYWIGRGDQTTCPDAMVTGSEGYFKATDAWQGRTVVWARLHCGDNGQMRERWPSTPPELNVEGDWSLIWDPRDDSLTPSSNQALITLDAPMNNPIRPYAETYLRLDTFAWAADVADQAVPAKGGGTLPRYRADGVLVWSDGAELEDQINPLLDAGASRLIRIGGQLGIVPAIARPAVHTITDWTDGQSVEMVRWQPGDDIYSEAVASYVAPDRAYEMAEAPVYIVPGAAAEDGGLVRRLDLSLDFVVDHRQAQRLAKIVAMRSRMQRTVSCELFPDAMVLVAGSVAALDVPAPYTAWNGLYEVEQIQPAAGVNDDLSITMRLPCSLRETSPAIYAWDAETEEQFVEGAVLDPWVATLSPPTGVSIISGGEAADISASGTITPRVQVSWDRAASSSVLRYEVQIMAQTLRRQGDDFVLVWPARWNDRAIVGVEDSAEARLYYYVPMVDLGHGYRARVRSVGIYGESDWVTSDDIVASAPERVILAPSILMATGGIGRVDLTLRQSNDANAVTMQLAASLTPNVAASAIIATVPAGSNVTVAQTESGLGNGVTRYYWLRARDSFGNASPWSAMASATTTT
ncbi:hypothetical protein HOY34_11040 [Xinfangfangia sp. D13-10-4-6]|uniref:phage tail protein n=1 Tax=Pseudogemmobacter hezensis TaxID=2737662 RepID=UPI0015545405|nr:phage tail protein [Pseudogemmobacter hezensis]NPD15737.1 hypothetical protein [Pseudogemmobacter hezensis]